MDLRSYCKFLVNKNKGDYDMKLFKKIGSNVKYRAAMATIAAGAGIQLTDDDRVNMFIIGIWIIGGLVELFKNIKKDSDKGV
jgi:hypothetical protein